MSGREAIFLAGGFFLGAAFGLCFAKAFALATVATIVGAIERKTKDLDELLKARKALEGT